MAQPLKLFSKCFEMVLTKAKRLWFINKLELHANPCDLLFVKYQSSNLYLKLYITRIATLWHTRSFSFLSVWLFLSFCLKKVLVSNCCSYHVAKLNKGLPSLICVRFLWGTLYDASFDAISKGSLGLWSYSFLP